MLYVESEENMETEDTAVTAMKIEVLGDVRPIYMYIHVYI